MTTELDIYIHEKWVSTRWFAARRCDPAASLSPRLGCGLGFQCTGV